MLPADGWWFTALALLGGAVIIGFLVAAGWIVWAMLAAIEAHEQDQRDADQLARDDVDPDWVP